MYILGISAFYHDSAAALIKNGQIIAAAQEERFTRKKHDSRFPHNAINYCLKEGSISGSNISYIVFYEKPFLKFERLIETYLAFAPKGFKSFSSSIPKWIKEKLFQKSVLLKDLSNTLGKVESIKAKLLFSEHHLSHAASAFYPSPFEEAGILTLDGAGEWATTSISLGKKNTINVIDEIHFPHSLGLLYSAFTYYLGFKVNSGEYKLMGLAPYGEPKFVNKIKENIINIKEDGSFALNMDYFGFCTDLKMTNKKFNKLFDKNPREPETTFTQIDLDIASSIQKVIEELVFNLAKRTVEVTGSKNLCLAGGVALNCVANGVLQRSGLVNNLWIQPASGDAGGAIGAALVISNSLFKSPRKHLRNNLDGMSGSYLGPSFNDKEITNELNNNNAIFEIIDDEDVLIDVIVEKLISGQSIGWFQDRMEFGPRALGNRSILADPRSTNMQRDLNLKIKYRESFRPFAPSILYDEVGKWFDLKSLSPYMLLVSKLRKEKLGLRSIESSSSKGLEKLKYISSKIPAVTHVDDTARIHTVDKKTNPKFYKLVRRFYEKTDVPILINTSFNIRGEPIVCSPTDAFKCFMGTGLDALAIGNHFLKKQNQLSGIDVNYKNNYDLD